MILRSLHSVSVTVTEVRTNTTRNIPPPAEPGIEVHESDIEKTRIEDTDSQDGGPHQRDVVKPQFAKSIEETNKETTGQGDLH
jgi:hypothetical protein